MRARWTCVVYAKFAQRQASSKAAAKPKTAPTPQSGQHRRRRGQPRLERDDPRPIYWDVSLSRDVSHQATFKGGGKILQVLLVKSSMGERGMRPCDPQPLLTPQVFRKTRAQYAATGRSALRTSSKARSHY